MINHFKAEFYKLRHSKILITILGVRHRSGCFGGVDQATAFLYDTGGCSAIP